MVLGRVASANTGCSASRTSINARKRSISGLSPACRLDFTSLADQPAVSSPCDERRLGKPGAERGNIGRGQDVGDC